MSDQPHSYQPESASRMARERFDANSRRSIKAARTKRLKRRQQPFEAIDAEVVALIKRITPPAEQVLSVNTARTILQAQTLRKELLLGKLKAEEIDARVEERDVRAEWEVVKRELGIAP